MRPGWRDDAERWGAWVGPGHRAARNRGGDCIGYGASFPLLSRPVCVEGNGSEDECERVVYVCMCVDGRGEAAGAEALWSGSSSRREQ